MSEDGVSHPARNEQLISHQLSQKTEPANVQMMALAGLCQARPQDFMLETQKLKSLNNRVAWPARVERAIQNHATLVWVILDQPKFFCYSKRALAVSLLPSNP